MAIAVTCADNTFQFDRDAWIRERVDNSIRLLDEHLGLDWPHRIKLDKFNIGNARHCVLAQLGGFNGYERLGEQMQISTSVGRYAFAGGEETNRCWRAAIRSLCEQRPEPEKRSRLPWRGRKRELTAI